MYIFSPPSTSLILQIWNFTTLIHTDIGLSKSNKQSEIVNWISLLALNNFTAFSNLQWGKTNQINYQTTGDNACPKSMTVRKNIYFIYQIPNLNFPKFCKPIRDVDLHSWMLSWLTPGLIYMLPFLVAGWDRTRGQWWPQQGYWRMSNSSCILN